MEAEKKEEKEEEAAQNKCPQDETTAVPSMDPGCSAAAFPHKHGAALPLVLPQESGLQCPDKAVGAQLGHQGLVELSCTFGAIHWALPLHWWAARPRDFSAALLIKHRRNAFLLIFLLHKHQPWPSLCFIVGFIKTLRTQVW